MLKIHHFGWLVSDISRAKQSIIELTHNGPSSQVYFDKLRSVNIQFVSVDNFTFELIQPLNDRSEVFTLLNKSGPTLYHICFEVDNLDEEINKCVNNGAIIIQMPSPASAINNKNVAFLYDKHIGVFELLEA